MTDPPFQRLRPVPRPGGAPSGLLFARNHTANAVPKSYNLGLAAALTA